MPEMPVEPTKLKVMIVGECNVGKTAFCRVAAGLDYPADAKPTVGSDYFMRTSKNISGLF